MPTTLLPLQVQLGMHSREELLPWRTTAVEVRRQLRGELPKKHQLILIAFKHFQTCLVSTKSGLWFNF